MELLVKSIKHKNNKLIVLIENISDKLVKSFTLNNYQISDDLLPNHTKKCEFPDFSEEIVIENIEFREIEDKKQTLDMTKGSIKKNILIFAIPIFISSLLQTLYNTIDSIIVGNQLGKEALAAVSSSGSLIYLFTSFFLGTAQGAGVLIAKLFGMKKYNQMSKAIHTNIAAGLISSIILTVIGVWLTPAILVLMKTDPDVLPNSITYFRYYFLGCTGIVMYNVMSGTLNAVGNSRRPLYYLAIASVLNVILDLLLVRYGIMYAALATTISQFLSAILCFIHLIRTKSIYHLSVKRINIDFPLLKEILKYGIPTGIQNSVIGLANVFVQSRINIFGKDAMAGNGAYYKVESFVFLPINAFTMAISTFISQNLGAKEHDRARKGANFGIITSMVMAELFGIFFFILAPSLIAIFNSDPEVIRYGVLHGRITSLCFFMLAYAHAIASVCRGSGKAFVPMLIMLFFWCIFRVSYIYVALLIKEEIWIVCSAYPVSWFLSNIAYFIYYNKSDWIHNFENIKNKDIDFVD